MDKENNNSESDTFFEIRKSAIKKIVTNAIKITDMVIIFLLISLKSESIPDF